MEEIKNALEQIAEEEYIRANKKFPLFNSDHEGQAVIEEEMIEVNEEYYKTQANFHQLKAAVFNDNETEKIINAEKIRKYALNTCAELVQVIAMCDKFVISKAKREVQE